METPTKILSVDPGTQGLAWAAWGYAELLAAGFARVPTKKAKAPIAARAMLLVAQIPGGADLGILEQMEHYAKVKKSQPNDLLDVQLVGAFVMGRLIDPAGEFRSVLPRDWKGNRPTEGVIERQVEKALAKKKGGT